METKFHGRRISSDEVIKSINVNFLFFRFIFFMRSIFAFLLFLRDSTLYSNRDDSDNLEMEVRSCWWYQEGVCCRQTVTGITVYTCSQRWARYFCKVTAVPVLGILLKIPAGTGTRYLKLKVPR